MNDASEVKRIRVFHLSELLCPRGLLVADESPMPDHNSELLPVTDHDRIVAELKAEIEALKRSELVNQIKGGQDYGDALDEIANLKRTLARRDRVIEKLREQRNACNGWHMSEEFMDKELEEIEQGEGM